MGHVARMGVSETPYKLSAVKFFFFHTALCSGNSETRLER